MTNLSENSFNKYRDFIYAETGISINHNKKLLLQMKLNKAMNKLNISSYDEYFELITKNKNNINFQKFINYITTNTTHFFRENNHFDFIKENIDFILENNPRIKKNKEIRVWSAGCSAGQEPITLSIVLNELFGNNIVPKILATDINTKVLHKAIQGSYIDSDCTGIPKEYLSKYFLKTDKSYEIKKDIQKFIKFRQFNLTSKFNFKKGFDIIFCRNVMIYFNNESQEQLINKFYDNIEPGGLFFVGHSESLINKNHSFKSIGPSIYIK